MQVQVFITSIHNPAVTILSYMYVQDNDKPYAFVLYHILVIYLHKQYGIMNSMLTVKFLCLQLNILTSFD